MTEPDHARAYAWAQLRRRALRMSWAFALLAVGFGVRRAAGVGPDGTDLLLGIALVVLVAWIAHASFVGTPEDEATWRAAVAERRWADVLGLLPRLGRVLPAAHLPMLRAEALAGLGRWPEARAIIEAPPPEALTRGDYYALLARVRAAAGDFPGQREAYEKALGHVPDPTEVLLALAELGLLLDQDPAAAEAAFERIPERARPGPTSPRHLALMAVIAFERGEVDAPARLEQALAAVEAAPDKTPEIFRLGPRLHAYLALWTARTGRAGEAAVHQRLALPGLQAEKNHPLLTRLASAGLGQRVEVRARR